MSRGLTYRPGQGAARRPDRFLDRSLNSLHNGLSSCLLVSKALHGGFARHLTATRRALYEGLESPWVRLMALIRWLVGSLSGTVKALHAGLAGPLTGV